MQGSEIALKWARRDLTHLEAVLDIVPGRTAVVQAGGCLGVFPKRLAQSFETVYCFEPAADLFSLLCANAPEANIVKMQAALGDSRRLVQTARVRRDGSGKPAHEGITHVITGGSIPTLLIDDLALPVCDLIYLDVEGMELYALRGAADTLWRCRPVVVVEINKSLDFVGLKPEDVTGFLKDHGYQHAMTMGSDQAFVPVER